MFVSCTASSHLVDLSTIEKTQLELSGGTEERAHQVDVNVAERRAGAYLTTGAARGWWVTLPLLQDWQL
jgi:hypothetical protein